MKKHIIYKILFLGFVATFCFSNVAMAKDKGTEVTATVVDQQGNPMEGVKIFATKGVKTSTSEMGTFSLMLTGDQIVVIEKEGFESQLINTREILGKITLEKSIFLASESDVIDQGLTTKVKRDMVGAYSSIYPKDRLTYDNTQWVRDYIQGLMVGVKGSDNIRGMGSALFVIDGVIGRDPNILNMDEVDQITVLKDANAVALYGNQAQNGVIVINTKRGSVNKRSASININYGMKTPVSLPNYLGSVDYMELYNEARANDGLADTYEPSLIEDYKNSTNPYLHPDVDLYSSDYLRDAATTANVNTQFTGGNDHTQYYINLGWKHDQSLVKTNPDANVGSNRFNVRANVDFKVNSWIKSSVDAVAIISTNRTSHSNLLNEGTSFKPNAYAPLLPMSMMDTANAVLAAQLEAAGVYDGNILGSSQVAKGDAPVADVIAGGYRNSTYRSTQFNNSIDFDLSMITKGLSAKTYLSFDFYDAYNVTIKNKYRVYEPTWTGDKISALTPYGDVDLKDLTENVSTSSFVSRLGFYGLLNYQKTMKEDHSINTSLIGYLNNQTQEDVLQADKNAHVALQLTYDYKKKWYADFSAAYINSIKLPEGNRGGLSPTVGLGYIISEEDFMSDVSFVNYLKLKASAGIIKSDLGIDDYYMYSESYNQGYRFTWADNKSNKRQDITQGENLNLDFEDRYDLNLGFESFLFNSIWFEFNYFKTDYDKQVTRLSSKYPSFYNDFRPYDNYNKDTYRGFELGLDYTKRFDNGFSVNVGGNLLYSQSEAVKRDENYEYAYQSRIGKPVSPIFGLVDNGFYSESDFTTGADGSYILNANLAVPSFGAVQPGDIKYQDQNSDDVIDDNDRIEIGNYRSSTSYGVNFKVNYKGFSLFVLGVGEFGGDATKSNSYYWVDGKDKYSETVLGRWTPETANTATYPRLSSGTNKNNFRTSTYWMYDNSYLDIKRAQLTYEFSNEVCKKMGMNNLSVNVAGSNILQISKNSDVRQLKIGGNPTYRHFTLGLRTSF